jgi:hypothetical protein
VNPRFLTFGALLALAMAARGPAALGEVPGLRPLMRDFVGLNSHAGDGRNAFKASLYRPTSRLLRAYHSLAPDLGDDTTQPPPFPLSKSGLDWAGAYQAWHDRGWEVDVSLRFEAIPRDRWKAIEADASAYGRAFAREFGPSGPRKIVSSVGLGNEPGDWSDEDCARMFRALARGVRDGDPAMKIATCNLTTLPSTRWEKNVATIARTPELFDILTIHVYAQLEGFPTWRRSYPEDPQLPDYLAAVERLCRWRDEHMPEKPVWITEFGYDSSTRRPDPIGRSARWVGVSDLQQAQWLVRSLLVFSAMPVERAYLFFFNDEDEPRMHGSSGLTRFFQPKPAFHAVAHLQRILGDFRFQRIVTADEGRLRVQEYVHATDPRRRIWIAWSPTGDGRGETVTLTGVPGQLIDAQRMPLSDGSSMEAAPLAHQDETGAISARVTGSPLYLFLRLP